MSLYSKFFASYLFLAGVAYSESKQYFYSSVGLNASLGPGAVLTSSKPGTFNSGVMQSTGVLPSSSSLYNGNFAFNLLNHRSEDSKNSVPVSRLQDGGEDPTQIRFQGVSANSRFSSSFSNEEPSFHQMRIIPGGSNLVCQFVVVDSRGGTERNTAGNINLQADAQNSNFFIAEPGQTITAFDNGGGPSQYAVEGGTIQKILSVRSAADPVTLATQVINFSQGIAEKNKTGLAYMFGVTSQYVSQGGMTVGLSLHYGRTGSTSSIDYAVGSLSNASFTAANDIRFSTKDTGFVSELLQLGYAYQRFNPYFIFGLAQHRAKMYCPNAYQNTGSSIKKGYNTPVFGIGLNVAITRNIYVNVQWQRHMGGVKSWGNITEIIPQGRVAMGAPQSRMGNTMLLFGVTYVTNLNGKR